ncbi:MAG TPA: phosphoribosyltransferase family protein [Candidatus Eisenbacteria bacterium]|nr:phosphoribosyltransferase family protein [Candidatus Eisenbacteria bacterium]
MIFKDRLEAGRLLAEILLRYKSKKPIVLGLPRGGVVVASQVARTLVTPLRVVMAKKITTPANPEFSIGALSERNIQILDFSSVKRLGISQEELESAIRQKKKELKNQIKLYRKKEKNISYKGKVIILVDDGLATGMTARAAIMALKKEKPRQIIFASPVCAPDTAREFEKIVDTVLCLIRPVGFLSVGEWYGHFEQVADATVIDTLNKSRLSIPFNLSS